MNYRYLIYIISTFFAFSATAYINYIDPAPSFLALVFAFGFFFLTTGVVVATVVYGFLFLRRRKY